MIDCQPDAPKDHDLLTKGSYGIETGEAELPEPVRRSSRLPIG